MEGKDIRVVRRLSRFCDIRNIGAELILAFLATRSKDILDSLIDLKSQAIIPY